MKQVFQRKWSKFIQTVVDETNSPAGFHLNAFTSQISDSLPGSKWVSERRRSAMEKLALLEFPTQENEIWRYSIIDQLDLNSYSPSLSIPSDSQVSSSFVEKLSEPVVSVVINDGWLKAVTNVDSIASSGVYVGPISKAPKEFESSKGTFKESSDFFGLFNSAFTPEPVLIGVPDGVRLTSPICIEIQSVLTGVVSCPRILVHLGNDAEIAIIEHHFSTDCDSLSLPVFEGEVGENSLLRHSVVQDLQNTTKQISKQTFRVEKAASVKTFNAGFGGNYARTETECRLVGRGSEAFLTAAYFGNEEQILDFRTFQKHEAPDTRSKLIFKGVLDDDSRSVYSGLIKVLPEAIRTRAEQTNRNIKLSENAWAESVPNLEIETNDVMCSHASTVSGVDEEHLFYLESRGVPTPAAEHLIVAGFYEEVFRGSSHSVLEEMLRVLLSEKLQKIPKDS